MIYYVENTVKTVNALIESKIPFDELDLLGWTIATLEVATKNEAAFETLLNSIDCYWRKA